MKNILTILTFTFFTSAIHAQITQVNDIKKTFDQTKDLGRLLSFSHILGKTFLCEEYVYNDFKKTYMTYSTRITFENKMKNYYGSQTTLDYVEYDEYRRIDQDNYS